MKLRKPAAALAALTLSLALLAACTPAASRTEGGEPARSPSPSGGEGGASASPCADWEQGEVITCRIADSDQEGNLLLTKEGGGAWDVYTLNAEGLEITLDGEAADPSQLRDGMVIDLLYSGMILESYPAQPAGAVAIRAGGEGTDDRCGLYLQVLEDLWNVDEGLNSGVSAIGLDLSGLAHLTDSEKAAVAWRFGQLRGLPVVEGTLEELAQEGYLSQVGSGKAPEGVEHPLCQWDDGVLFTVATDTEAVWNLPALTEGEEPPVLTAFDAQKWRSGDGAYFFAGCVARQGEDGAWTYTVGSELIS